jgi:hypothetical protein
MSQNAVPGASRLHLAPLYGAGFVLWSYIASFYVYKTWYIATALVVTVLWCLAAVGVVRTRGWVRALLPVSSYFAVLMASSLWAEYPAMTRLWVGIDSIEILVVFVFFLALRNSSPQYVTSMLMWLVVPAVIMSTIMYYLDPTLSRLAHYALPLLPVIVPFAFVHMVWSGKRTVGLLTLVVSFAVLAISRSRTPLVEAIIAALLSMFVFRKNIFEFFRRLMIGGLTATMALALMLAIPVTRRLVVMTYVRFSYQTVHWDDLYVEAEKVDQIRIDINDLAWKLGVEHFPMGIGYMNFAPNFDRFYNFPINLHSMYVTWFTEGGVLCLAVIGALVWRHLAGLRSYMRSGTREERLFAKACLIASLGVAFAGLSQQLHQTPVLWLLVGLGSAAAATARERRSVRRRALSGRTRFVPVPETRRASWTVFHREQHTLR